MNWKAIGKTLLVGVAGAGFNWAANTLAPALSATKWGWLAGLIPVGLAYAANSPFFKNNQPPAAK